MPHMEIDSLDTLIKAVETYREDLATNRQMLVNAGDACDMAMGSDDIVKKQLAKLNEALEELDKTAKLAEEVTEELIADRTKAIQVYED